jgi:hypothetical protein
MDRHYVNRKIKQKCLKGITNNFIPTTLVGFVYIFLGTDHLKQFNWYASLCLLKFILQIDYKKDCFKYIPHINI